MLLKIQLFLSNIDPTITTIIRIIKLLILEIDGHIKCANCPTCAICTTCATCTTCEDISVYNRYINNEHVSINIYYIIYI